MAFTTLREVAPGVLITTHEPYTTNTTVVVGSDGGCLVVDPAVSAADLASLAEVLDSRGLRVTCGFSTHPHWDHVLWCRALGTAPRYATPRAVRIAEAERDGMVAGVEAAAPGHDLALLGTLTPLPQESSAIPWPGPTVHVLAHDAHAAGAAALWLPEVGVLVAGDLLSDIEIPLLDLEEPDPLRDYRQALERFSALGEVAAVVPGHGHIAYHPAFRERLEKDLGYLDDLEQGRVSEDVRLTLPWLQRAHEAQWAYCRDHRG